MRHEKELADERQRQKAVLDEQRSAILNLQDRMQKRKASLVQAKKEVHADCCSVYMRIRGCRGEKGGAKYKIISSTVHSCMSPSACTVENVWWGKSSTSVVYPSDV